MALMWAGSLIPNPLRQIHRVMLHSPNVAMCDLVFRIDCHSEGLDRGHVELIQFNQMPIGVLRTTHGCENVKYETARSGMMIARKP